MYSKQAQKALAEMLLHNTGDTAYMRLEDQAKRSKQSVEKVAYRVAGNLLQSLVVRKPDGFVDF